MTASIRSSADLTAGVGDALLVPRAVRILAGHDAEGNLRRRHCVSIMVNPTSGAFSNLAIGVSDMGIKSNPQEPVSSIPEFYIGGQGEDQPSTAFVDAQGNLVISGRTNL